MAFSLARANVSGIRDYAVEIDFGGSSNIQQAKIGEIGDSDTTDSFSSDVLTVDVKHLAWPEGRSYPSRLDIDVKKNGISVGGTSFSINSLEDLKNISPFGLTLSMEGVEAQVKFDFRERGQQLPQQLTVSGLEDEVLFLDVVAAPLNFQMVRPVVLEPVATGVWGKEFRLDAHPYEVTYYAHDVTEGVLFISELRSTAAQDDSFALIKTFYTAPTLDIFRRAMFAGHYTQGGSNFKVIYYPALGQR